jgi:deoxyhypusine synthase
MGFTRKGLNRVTDTCIPEHEAFRRLQKHIYKIWKDADDKGERYFPHEFMYKMLLSGVLEEYYEIDLKTAGCMQLRKNYYCTRLGR